MKDFSSRRRIDLCKTPDRFFLLTRPFSYGESCAGKLDHLTLPYTYTWSMPFIAGLNAGTYTVTVTDSKQCTVVKSVTVTQPAEIVLTISKTNVSCTGNTNGSAEVSATGGTGTFTYLWSNGQTTTNISNLPVGNYSVTATDANNCKKTATVSIIVEPLVNIQPLTYIGSLASCTGQVNATLTCTASWSGSTPLSYQWLHSPNGSSWSSALGANTNLTYDATLAGYYKCKVSNSCGDKFSNTISASGLPTVSIPDLGNCITKTMTADVNPLSSVVSHQWQKRNNTDCSLGTWQSISGANAIYYTPIIGGRYRLITYFLGCTNGILSNSTCVSNTPCPTAPTLTANKDNLTVFEDIDFGTYQPEWVDANEVFPMIEVSDEGIITEIKGATPSLLIAPNPTTDHLRLQYTLVENGMTQLSIVNLTGVRKTIWRAEKQFGDYTENLTNEIDELPTGIYFIELATPTKIITQKMVKVE